MTTESPEKAEGVRRTVGIAALQRLRRLADEKNTEERWKARWAFRIAAFFALLAGLLAAWLSRHLL